MRSTFLLACLLISGLSCFSQNSLIDSLHAALKKQKTDTGRALILNDLSNAYTGYKPDSALLLAQEAYDLAARRHFLKAESGALGQIASAFKNMGNNTQALDYYLRQLKIEEERGFADNVATVNMSIALVYNREKDTTNAISYILKADSIISSNKLDYFELYGLLNTGDIYEKADRLPEALSYTQQCYNRALESKDSLMIGSSLNNLGNIYAKSGDIEKAIMNYRASVVYLGAANDDQTISEGKLGLARIYDGKGASDSALQYATSAYNISIQGGFLKNALAASTLLTDLYKKKKNTDSAFAYQNIMVSLKDSVQGIDRIKQLASMSIEEQLRQQHLRAMAEEVRDEERQKLQLLGIGIMIPVFFLITMYISRRKVNRKVIAFSGVVSLLLLFEYITLFIHPFVTRVTHHTPLFEILIFVCIAALVVPAHHRIEGWFTSRLAGINERHMQKAVVVVNSEGEEETVFSEEKIEAEPGVEIKENAPPETDTDEASSKE